MHYRTAMEKMQTVYSQNPALGDPKQVQQSLEVTHGKLDDLNAELYKFKVNNVCGVYIYVCVCQYAYHMHVCVCMCIVCVSVYLSYVCVIHMCAEGNGVYYCMPCLPFD